MYRVTDTTYYQTRLLAPRKYPHSSVSPSLLLAKPQSWIHVIEMLAKVASRMQCFWTDKAGRYAFQLTYIHNNFQDGQDVPPKKWTVRAFPQGSKHHGSNLAFNHGVHALFMLLLWIEGLPLYSTLSYP